MIKPGTQIDPGIIDLVDRGVFIPCSCKHCKGKYEALRRNNGVGVFKLKDTPYHLFYEPNAKPPVQMYTWLKITCNCVNPCDCTHGNMVKFEEVFNEAEEEGLLWHLNLFT